MTRSLLVLATYAAVLREPAIRANAISVAVLCDSSVPELFNVSRLTEVLSRQPSLQVAVVSTKELANAAVVSPSIYQLLILPNAPALPLEATANYHAFAMGGGSLLLLGGKPRIVRGIAWGDPAAHINVMEDYAPLRMPEIVSVDVAQNNSIVPPGSFNLSDGRWAGLSSVGWAVPGRAHVTPVLVARKSYGRPCGWAAALVENYGGWGPQCQPLKPAVRGCFVGASFLVFGITSPSFYGTSEFIDMIGPAAARLAAHRPAPPVRPLHPQVFSHRPDRTPMRPLVVGEDKRTLVVSGTDEVFHALGVNFAQMSWPNPLVENTVTPALIQADVEKIAKLGINCVRLACCWGPLGFVPNSTALTQFAMDLLAAHRLRVLYTLPVCTSEEQCAEYAARTLDSVLTQHRDAVFAVDVRNEVVAEELASFTCRNGSTLGQLVGGWDTSLWQRFRVWANVSRDFDNFRYVKHRLDQDLPAEFQHIFAATDRMYATFLSWLIPTVRTLLPTALVCCGTFDELELLPAAGAADFACHHSYPTVAGVVGQCDCPTNGGGCLSNACGEIGSVPLTEVIALPQSLEVIDRIFQENGQVRPLIHGEQVALAFIRNYAHCSPLNDFMRDLITSSPCLIQVRPESATA